MCARGLASPSASSSTMRIDVDNRPPGYYSSLHRVSVNLGIVLDPLSGLTPSPTPADQRRAVVPAVPRRAVPLLLPTAGDVTARCLSRCVSRPWTGRGPLLLCARGAVERESPCAAGAERGYAVTLASLVSDRCRDRHHPSCAAGGGSPSRCWEPALPELKESYFLCTGSPRRQISHRGDPVSCWPAGPSADPASAMRSHTSGYAPRSLRRRFGENGSV